MSLIGQWHEPDFAANYAHSCQQLWSSWKIATIGSKGIISRLIKTLKKKWSQNKSYPSSDPGAVGFRISRKKKGWLFSLFLSSGFRLAWKWDNQLSRVSQLIPGTLCERACRIITHTIRTYIYFPYLSIPLFLAVRGKYIFFSLSQAMIKVPRSIGQNKWLFSQWKFVVVFSSLCRNIEFESSSQLNAMPSKIWMNWLDLRTWKSSCRFCEDKLGLKVRAASLNCPV